MRICMRSVTLLVAKPSKTNADHIVPGWVGARILVSPCSFHYFVLIVTSPDGGHQPGSFKFDGANIL